MIKRSSITQPSCERKLEARIKGFGNPESQQTLVSMAVVVSPFGFSEMQGEGGSAQVWEPVCRFLHWTSVAKRAVV